MSLSFANNTLSLTAQDVDYILEIIFVTNEMSDEMKLAYEVNFPQFSQVDSNRAFSGCRLARSGLKT
jgi:hypothetical protein